MSLRLSCRQALYCATASLPGTFAKAYTSAETQEYRWHLLVLDPDESKTTNRIETNTAWLHKLSKANLRLSQWSHATCESSKAYGLRPCTTLGAADPSNKSSSSSKASLIFLQWSLAEWTLSMWADSDGTGLWHTAEHTKAGSCIGAKCV